MPINRQNARLSRLDHSNRNSFSQTEFLQSVSPLAWSDNLSDQARFLCLKEVKWNNMSSGRDGHDLSQLELRLSLSSGVIEL